MVKWGKRKRICQEKEGKIICEQETKSKKKRKEILEFKKAAVEQWMQMLLLMWDWNQLYNKVLKFISVTFVQFMSKLKLF